MKQEITNEFKNYLSTELLMYFIDYTRQPTSISTELGRSVYISLSVCLSISEICSKSIETKAVFTITETKNE